MKKLLFILALCPVFGFTQESFEYAKNEKNVALVGTSFGTYRFEAFGNGGIDVHFKTHQQENYNRASLCTQMPEMHRIVNTPVLNETKDKVSITFLNASSVVVTKNPFSIGYKSATDTAVIIQKSQTHISDSVKWSFDLQFEIGAIGGGARATGPFISNNSLELYNRAHYGYETHAPLMNFSMPIIMYPHIMMIHFDNTSKGVMDIQKDYKNNIDYRAESGEQRYQIILGNSTTELLQDYTLLTGNQPLLPRWAFGNFASRFGYRSSREVNELVKKYKKENVPLDAVILDLYWFGKTIQGTMGNLAFDTDSFPKPKRFLRRLNRRNIKPIVITEPFILTSSDRWEETLAADILCKDSTGEVHTYDFYFGNTGLIDVFDPKAQVWFWNIYKELHGLGVRGIWGDLGEPEVHPEAILHYGGLKANDIHNAYGHQWAKIIYEGYQQDFPDERLFNLMRAGAPGSQRYGIIPWSGDVNRSWGGLQSQPSIAMNMGLQGMAYMHSDLGGFAGDYDDSELYIRWLQYGVFQPIFRPHAQEEVASEPVLKDPETLRIVKKAIELRYKLLPYNYNLMHINSATGIPLMRPLYFEGRGSSDIAYSSHDTYYWGDDFLISPVLEKGATTKRIVLPRNTSWIDYYTGIVYPNQNGGEQIIEIPVNLEYIPTFVRAGAIIPMISNLQNTSQYKQKNIELHFYLDSSVQKHTYTFIDDNDLPENHPKYKKDHIEVSYELTENAIKLSITKNGKPTKIFNKNLFIHWRAPKVDMLVNGKKVKAARFV